MRDNNAIRVKLDFKTNQPFPESVNAYNKRGTHLATIPPEIIYSITRAILEKFAAYVGKTRNLSDDVLEKCDC